MKKDAISAVSPARRGRKTILNAELTQRIIDLIAQGCDQKTACSICGIGERTFHEWKEKGLEGKAPYADFFDAVSKARNEFKRALIACVVLGARGGLPKPADWKAAAWLLSKGWPREFSDRLPLPQEDDQPPMVFPMYATLPDGTSVPAMAALATLINFPRRDTFKPPDEAATTDDHETEQETEPLEPVPEYNRLD
jgi:hypothetical protein